MSDEIRVAGAGGRTNGASGLAGVASGFAGEGPVLARVAVASSAVDFSALAARVFDRFGNRSIYMPRVQRDQTVARIRSPRLRTP
jgi:hypothetical protein